MQVIANAKPVHDVTHAKSQYYCNIEVTAEIIVNILHSHLKLNSLSSGNRPGACGQAEQLRPASWDIDVQFKYYRRPETLRRRTQEVEGMMQQIFQDRDRQSTYRKSFRMQLFGWYTTDPRAYIEACVKLEIGVKRYVQYTVDIRAWSSDSVIFQYRVYP